MNNVIKAYEVKLGCEYRLFPNRKRSRYLVTKCVDVRDGHPIFLYTDKERNMEKIIKDVAPLENVQVVSTHE